MSKVLTSGTKFDSDEIYSGTANDTVLPENFMHTEFIFFLHLFTDLFYTKLLEVNWFAFGYRLFHEDSLQSFHKDTSFTHQNKFAVALSNLVHAEMRDILSSLCITSLHTWD